MAVTMTGAALLTMNRDIGMFVNFNQDIDY